MGSKVHGGSRPRRLYAMSLAALLIAFGATAAPVERTDGPWTASLQCPERVPPGRITCTLQLAASEGWLLAWSDALVVKAPEFAPPLKSRVQHAEGMGEAARQLSLALLASGPGRGELRVEARAVLCPRGGEAGACQPFRRSLHHPVVVEP